MKLRRNETLLWEERGYFSFQTPVVTQSPSPGGSGDLTGRESTSPPVNNTRANAGERKTPVEQSTFYTSKLCSVQYRLQYTLYNWLSPIILYEEEFIRPSLTLRRMPPITYVALLIVVHVSNYKTLVKWDAQLKLWAWNSEALTFKKNFLRLWQGIGQSANRG